MKILIENFGPIKRFEYDLDKELIITYGNNNIGKSYAMQIVYLLLKAFIGNLFMPSRIFRQMNMIHGNVILSMPEGKIEKMVRDFKESDDQMRDITSDILGVVNRLISGAFMSEFMNSCKNTFGNLEKNLEKHPLITIYCDEYNFKIKLRDSQVEGEMNIKPVHLKKTNSDFHKSKNFSTHLDIYVVDDIEKPTEIIYGKIQEFFIDCVRHISGDFGNVYFLPASRSGIYAGMNAFGSIVAELSKNRAYFTKKIVFPGISEPISDYFIALSNIRTRENKDLESIYSGIEDNILKGKVTFDKNKNALIYKPDNIDALYEMTEVSSMVSEISPIVAFLKYIVFTGNGKNKKSKSILFIEEPEAHLHPDNQIALVEMFTKLIGQDVKLIISSHSNYVFNKINNLILAQKLDYKVYDPIVLKETSGGSISEHIAIDELGADDENFVNVSDKLYLEREEIIEKLNMGD